MTTIISAINQLIYIYTPFSILKAFAQKEAKDYWLELGCLIFTTDFGR